jgi:hypothetical protein
MSARPVRATQQDHVAKKKEFEASLGNTVTPHLKVGFYILDYDKHVNY